MARPVHALVVELEFEEIVNQIVVEASADNDPLTSEEAANYLGLSEDDLGREVTAGTLPAYEVGVDKYVLFKAELVRAVRQRPIEPTTGATGTG